MKTNFDHVKTILFTTLFLLGFAFANAQTPSKKVTNDDDYDAPFRMFQGGLGGSYNDMIGKYGVNSRFFFNINTKTYLGPEFTYYFANKTTKAEYFFEVNITRNIVPIGKVAFFGLTGATWRFGDTEPVIDNTKSFQGINLGFGMSWRKDHWSWFVTEKITSLNANLWLNAGVAYYFDIPALARLTNIYNLNKRTRKE